MPDMSDKIALLVNLKIMYLISIFARILIELAFTVCRT
jgi:hypothetical protein